MCTLVIYERSKINNPLHCIPIPIHTLKKKKKKKKLFQIFCYNIKVGKHFVFYNFQRELLTEKYKLLYNLIGLWNADSRFD